MALGLLAAMGSQALPCSGGAAGACAPSLSALAPGERRTAAPGRTARPRQLPPGARLIRVPMTRQAADYTCGVAALQSVLGWFGEDEREDVLARELKADPEEGTDFRRIAEAGRRRGLKVEVRKGASLADLKAALDSGNPSILSVQAWSDGPADYARDWKDGHYVVAIGYDAERFYFMDPSVLGHYGFVPAAELRARWHDEESPGERISGLMLTFSKKGPVRDPEAILPIE